MFKSKKHSSRHVFSALVALLLLIALVLPACDSGSTAKTEDSTKTAENDETTERLWLDNLPDDVSFDGQTLLLLSELSNWISPVDGGKEVVSAAQLNMYNNVTSRFDFEVKLVELPSEDGDVYGDRNKIQRSVLSQLYEFDLTSSRGYTTAPLAMEGYFINLNNADGFENIEVDQPWWNDDYFKEMQIGNTIFWLSGLPTVGMINCSFATFFNSELMNIVLSDRDDNKTIYDIVRDGQWTLDTMLQFSRKAYKDDGNGEKDINDQFGSVVYESYLVDNLAICAGADYTTRDENNIPVMNIGTEKNILINEKLYDLLHDESYSPYAGGEHEGSYFKDGRLLMICAPIYWSGSRYRDTVFDWGAIPMPKLDENQENYLTTLTEYWMCTGIPKTAKSDRYNFTLTVADAFSAEMYRLVRPAILDDALKNKYTRDEDTKEMIDLIQAHTTTDFFIIYGYDNRITEFFKDASATSRDISSTIARKNKAFGKVLDTYVNAFEDNSN